MSTKRYEKILRSYEDYENEEGFKEGHENDVALLVEAIVTGFYGTVLAFFLFYLMCVGKESALQKFFFVFVLCSVTLIIYCSMFLFSSWKEKKGGNNI